MSNKKLNMSGILSVSLKEKKANLLPFWYMRQSGRYLPDYMKIRKKFPSFSKMILNTEACVEATLIPMNLFDPDAAIIFSDILSTAASLGAKLDYESAKGPTAEIENLNTSKLEIDKSIFESTFKAIKLVKEELKEKDLIGFVGCPWTIFCYIVGGPKKDGAENAKRFAYEQPITFANIMSNLEKAVIVNLQTQIQAGVTVVQLFESWANVLSFTEFEKWSLEPTKRIIDSIYKKVPIIFFPKGCGNAWKKAVEKTNTNAISLDSSFSIKQTFQGSNVVLQGNLDNIITACDIQIAMEETDRILKESIGKPLIFNLGHGVLPFTPPENLIRISDRVKEFRSNLEK